MVSLHVAKGLIMRFMLAMVVAGMVAAGAAMAQPMLTMDGLKDGVQQTEQAGQFINIAQTLQEHVLGNADAPVTVIEYASLTCPHCAHFSKEILPQVIEKYVKTGKIKIIYRDFPLNALALQAAQLAQCMPEDRYYPFIKTLFDNLDSWESAKDPLATLKQYAKLAGLGEAKINSCMDDKALTNALVKRRMEAEKQFNITGTPSFVVNYSKDTVTGVQDIGEFDAMLAKYIKK